MLLLVIYQRYNAGSKASGLQPAAKINLKSIEKLWRASDTRPRFFPPARCRLSESPATGGFVYFFFLNHLRQKCLSYMLPNVSQTI